MKKATLYTVGIRTACMLSLACMLSACGTAADNSETEALRQQIADLQQQVSDLQQQNAADSAAPAPSGESGEVPVPAQETPAEQPQAPTDVAQPDAPADSTQPAGPTADTQAPATDNTANSAPAGTDDDTMESLTALVDDFTSRAATLTAGSNNAELDQFFTYKQEAEGIDRRLDRYENDLERQVRDGSLSRDDYRSAERELDKLEDSLDNAEDKLEYYFGIDD